MMIIEAIPYKSHKEKRKIMSYYQRHRKDAIVENMDGFVYIEKKGKEIKAD